MIDFIINVLPWWAPLVVAVPAALLAARYFGVNAGILIGVLAIAATIYAKGRKAGAAVEVQKQHKADDHARDVIHETKEGVRTAPRAEINKRASRWEKP